MEDQTLLQRTHADHNPSGLEGEDENHNEKKSVLQKVKAKAKKIKNTLVKHYHDHDHDPGEYEVEDKDEETVEDPETHAAPICDSDAVKSGNLERPSEMDEDRNDSKMADPPVRPFNQRQEEEYGQPKGNLSGLTAKDEVHHLPEDKNESFSTGNYDIGNRNPTGKDLHGQEENPDQERNKIGFPTATEGIRGSNRKKIIGQEQNFGGQTGRNGMGTGMEEDPPGPNVRNVPATDPNGRGSEEAAGITPILSSFNKMGIDDNPEQKPEAGENLYPGSHDQFSPEPLSREYPDSVPKSYDPNNPKDLPRETLSGDPSSQTSTHAGKLTSAASSIADTAISAKNLVASKLGYSENKSTGAPLQEVQGQGDTTKPASATDYADKIAPTVTETLAPVYGKVAGAGSTIVSKVQGSGTGTDNEGQDEGVVSVKEHLTEKLKPGEEDAMITGSFIEHKAEIEQKTKAGEEVSTEELGVSKVTSDAFHMSEPEGSGEVTSDAFHKREPEGSGEVITGSFIKHRAEIEQKTKAGEEVSTEGGRGVSEVTSDAFNKREPEDAFNKREPEGSGEVTSDTFHKREPKGGGEVNAGSFIKHKAEIEQKAKAGEEVSTEGGRGVSEVTSDAFNKRESEVTSDAFNKREPEGSGEVTSDAFHKRELGGSGEVITDSFIKHRAEIEQKTKAGEEVSTEGGRGVSEVTSDAFNKRESEVTSDVFNKREPEGSGEVTSDAFQKREPGGSGEVITDSFIKHKAETEQKTKAGEEVSTEGGRGVSEVTSDAFNKREPEGSGEVTSDAFHKSEPVGSGDRKPLGKVTESEEVAKQLGTGGEEEVAKRLGTGGGEEDGGKGVIERVKGVFGSWLGGKGGDTQTTPGTTYAGDDEHGQKAASE